MSQPQDYSSGHYFRHEALESESSVFEAQQTFTNTQHSPQTPFNSVMALLEEALAHLHLRCDELYGRLESSGLLMIPLPSTGPDARAVHPQATQVPPGFTVGDLVLGFANTVEELREGVESLLQRLAV
mgnify:CR=1 FL=1